MNDSAKPSSADRGRAANESLAQRAESMAVLAVVADEQSRQQIRIAAEELGDTVHFATTISQALDICHKHDVVLAVVDVELDSGNALALVHHIPAVSPSARVVAACSREGAERGADAITVGADALYILPLTCDAMIAALGARRGAILEARQRRALSVELASELKRRELRDRVLRRAQRGEYAEALEVLVQALLEQGLVRGAAVYLDQKPESPGDSARFARYAASGSLLALPLEAAELLEVGRTLFIWALPFAGRDLGALIADEPTDERAVTTMIELVSMVVALDERKRVAAKLSPSAKPPKSLVVPEPPEGVLPTHSIHAIARGTSRVYTPDYFTTLGLHELARARRYDRRISLLTVAYASKLQAALLASAVRCSDVVVETEDTLVFVMPETNTFGAHACLERLKRVLANERVRQTDAVALPGFGIATYPHDGHDLNTLLRVSFERASSEPTSVVSTVSAKGLAGLVDALVARPLHVADGRSTFPLDVSMPSLTTLISHACGEAKRSGQATFLVTEHPGLGLSNLGRILSTTSGTAATTVAAMRSPAATGPARIERRGRTAIPGVEGRDVRGLPRCADVLIAVVRGEQGTWTACGRIDRDRFIGIHTADPHLADILSEHLRAGERMEVLSR